MTGQQLTLFGQEVAEVLSEKAVKMLAIFAAAGGAPHVVLAMVEAFYPGVKLTADERHFILGPVVQHQSAWNDTLPTWAVPQIRQERIEIVLLKSRLPVGHTEVMAVMIGSMMDAPRPSDVTEVYLWASTHACARQTGRPVEEYWTKLDHRPITDDDILGRRYGHWVPSFLRSIRDKVIAAQKERNRSQRA